MPPLSRGEGGQEGGVVLAQVGAEPVVGGGAVPDGVLLGAGQHRDGLGQLGVGRQRPVRVHVGAQHVGQHDRVAVVGFRPGDRVPVPVAGHRHRVDRVDRAAGGAQARDQQPARGLDRHRDRVIRGVAVLGEQGQQRRQPGRVVADPAAGQQLPVPVHEGDVVVIFGPVDPAVNLHPFPPSPRYGRCPCRPQPRRARTLPNGRARWPAIRLAVRDPSCPQAPVLARARRLRRWSGVAPAGGSGHDHRYRDERWIAWTCPGVSPAHWRQRPVPAPGSSTRGTALVTSAGHRHQPLPQSRNPAGLNEGISHQAGGRHKPRTSRPHDLLPGLDARSMPGGSLPCAL